MFQLNNICRNQFIIQLILVQSYQNASDGSSLQKGGTKAYNKLLIQFPVLSNKVTERKKKTC